MKTNLTNLCIKIGRIGRKKFFLYHMYIVLIILGFFLLLYLLGELFAAILFYLCGDHNCIGGTRIRIEYGIYLIELILFFTSNFLLAKRFQDCGINGLRALIFPIISVVLTIIPEILGFDLNSFLDKLPTIIGIISSICIMILSLFLILYPLLIIIMCFIKGNPNKNKYGKTV